MLHTLRCLYDVFFLCQALSRYFITFPLRQVTNVIAPAPENVNALIRLRRVTNDLATEIAIHCSVQASLFLEIWQ